MCLSGDRKAKCWMHLTDCKQNNTCTVKELNRDKEKDGERGEKEMFGIRVEKLSALGIVPDGHKPLPPFINSLWLLCLPCSTLCQSLLLSLTPVVHNSAATLQGFGDPRQKIWTNWHFYVCSLLPLTISSVPPAPATPQSLPFPKSTHH